MINRSGQVLQTILQYVIKPIRRLSIEIDSFRRVASILTDSSLDVTTVRFKFPPSTLRKLDEQLRQHPLYAYATDLLSKNQSEKDFQLFSSDDRCSTIFNPFCLTTAICILSENIASVRLLFRLWFRVDEVKYEVMNDFFYFLLTLFTGANRLHHLQFR